MSQDLGRPRVGVSSCLLGEQVRYNGGHSRSRFLTAELATSIGRAATDATGTNFRDIPELHWGFGYAWSWGLIVVTTIGQLVFFRWKRWF